jgi:hypothetical protein
MKLVENSRGFFVIEGNEYPDQEKVSRIIQESSAIGDYSDSFDRPGSSYLWIGNNHHLNREEVLQLVKYMNNWLKNGRLK